MTRSWMINVRFEEPVRSYDPKYWKNTVLDQFGTHSGEVK